MKSGIFLERPNRFIARVEIGGTIETVHVKNTGRCRELLTPGAIVYVEDHKSSMGARKTRWDLIAVEKPVGEGANLQGCILINMDSQAPNKVVAEGLRAGAIVLPDFPKHISRIKSEAVYGASRFDFYVEGITPEGETRSAYIEVKGVTLEDNGIARFPDAPTERGVKHIRELCRAKEQSFGAYILFLIQMQPVLWLEPNDQTHKAFGDALREAEKQGVHVLAYDCRVTENSLTVDRPVEVRLGPKETE